MHELVYAYRVKPSILVLYVIADSYDISNAECEVLHLYMLPDCCKKQYEALDKIMAAVPDS